MKRDRERTSIRLRVEMLIAGILAACALISGLISLVGSTGLF